MKLRRLAAHWHAFGRRDPLWAVLTDPARRGGKWDVEEFFATGERDVARLFARLEELGVEPRRGAALDFGCGVGRLTRALGRRFERAVGVDIAPSMIETARRLGGEERATYVLNQEPHLGIFPDDAFDFILSWITLQHMRPAYAEGYLAEFARLLAPGGVLCFQLPARPAAALPRRARLARRLPPPLLTALRALRGRLTGQPVMETYAIPRPRVEEVLTAAGLHLLATTPEPDATPGWQSYAYVAARPRRPKEKGTTGSS